MVDEIVHVGETAIGDTGSIKYRDRLVAGQRREPRRDDGIERRSVLHAGDVRREALVIGERDVVQDVAAQLAHSRSFCTARRSALASPQRYAP